MIISRVRYAHENTEILTRSFVRMTESKKRPSSRRACPELLLFRAFARDLEVKIRCTLEEPSLVLRPGSWTRPSKDPLNAERF